MRAKRLAGGLALALVLVACRSAWAQQQSAECTVYEERDQRRDAARTAFEQGQQLAEQQRFAEALGVFQCSFQNVPHPNTLYNIAWAAELAGQLARALDAWRGYLRMAPEAEDRAQVEERIRVLEQATSSTGTGQTGTQPTTPTTPPPQAAPAPQQYETPRNAPTDVYAPVAPGQQYQVVERRPPSPWRYWSWYIMGAGLVTAAVGLAIGLNVDNVCGLDAAEYDAGVWDSGCQIAGWSLLGIGGATAIAGLFVFLFSERGGEYVVTRTAGVSPTLTTGRDGRPDGLAMNLALRF